MQKKTKHLNIYLAKTQTKKPNNLIYYEVTNDLFNHLFI